MLYADGLEAFGHRLLGAPAEESLHVLVPTQGEVFYSTVHRRLCVSISEDHVGKGARVFLTILVTPSVFKSNSRTVGNNWMRV